LWLKWTTSSASMLLCVAVAVVGFWAVHRTWAVPVISTTVRTSAVNLLLLLLPTPPPPPPPPLLLLLLLLPTRCGVLLAQRLQLQQLQHH